MQSTTLVLVLGVLAFSGADAARLSKVLASRSLSAANLPDPLCKSGILSMAGSGPDPQVCCPKYCGECSDYPTCATKQGGSNAQLDAAATGGASAGGAGEEGPPAKSGGEGPPAEFLQLVAGFDPEGASAAACCASKVAEMECGKGAPANVCLKKCADSLPPCIMEKGEKFELPAVTSAAEDCNEAIPEWMEKAEQAVSSAVDDGSGEEQWKDYEKREVEAATSRSSYKDASVSLGLAQKKKKKTTVGILEAAGFTKEQIQKYIRYKQTGKYC